ncbi:MAG: hypothetical protein DSZ11_04005 [Sulfurovum sp.]|nr:MAG: hypothetical protein DSZ11_04005 [Sulfurovum sp.]
MKKIFTALLLGSISLTQASGIKPIIQLAIDAGGDELVTIEHDYSSDVQIDAGDGFSLEAGMAIEVAPNFENQLLIGYKFKDDNAYNGDISWDSTPLSALGFFKVQNWKFGGGLTYHISPELDGQFDNDEILYEFENALGVVAQVQYEVANSFAIGIRATFIEYERKNDHTQTANGNSLGVVGTFKFGGERSRFR